MSIQKPVGPKRPNRLQRLSQVLFPDVEDTSEDTSEDTMASDAPSETPEVVPAKAVEADVAPKPVKEEVPHFDAPGASSERWPLPGLAPMTRVRTAFGLSLIHI